MRKDSVCKLIVSFISLSKFVLWWPSWFIAFWTVLNGTCVTTDSAEWGLFSWCYKKEVYAALKHISDALQKDDISECYDIHPGDSPAYFEVVRFFMVLSAVLIFGNFLCMVPSLHQVDTLSLKFCLVSEVSQLLSIAVTVGVQGTYYKDDPRWKDDNPSLGSDFWRLTIIFLLYTVPSLFFSFIYLHALCLQNREESGQGCNRCKFRLPRPSLRLPTRRKQTPNSRPPTRRKQTPGTYEKYPANADLILSVSMKMIILRRAQRMRAFKLAMKYLSSGAVGKHPRHPRYHQSQHPDPFDRPAIGEHPTGDQPGRPQDAHPPPSGDCPVSGGQRADAACCTVDIEDHSSDACIQQEGQEPTSGRSDHMDLPSVHCVSQPQRLPADSYCITAYPNSPHVFELKLVEDRIEIVHI